ncbi:MAG: TauD/TfdA family dioxygenase [Dongiaceae bacterium]
MVESPAVDRRGAIDMLDLAPYATPHRIRTIEREAAALRLSWSGGLVSRFSHLWLRDNCACPICRHPDTMERRFLFIDALDLERPASYAPLAASLGADGALELLWPSTKLDARPHRSRFDPAWLRYHAPEEQRRRREAERSASWDATIAGRLPRITYDEMMQTDEGLARWLEALLDPGVVLMTGAPARDGEVQRVAERVQPPRWTNFGAVFDVVSMPKPVNSAYTPIGLEPHSDLPYYRRPGDYQLLFCVVNEAEGGDSILVDGFRAAERLRDEDADAFALLARTSVAFRYQDETTDFRAAAPTIETGRDGEPCAIRINNWTRGTLDLDPEASDALYRALGCFWRITRDPALQLRLKLNPGEMVAFRNDRVLHGRTPFDPASGRRRLQGCYIDSDQVLSKLRVIARHRPSPAA